jgi:hypothetical protein
LRTPTRARSRSIHSGSASTPSCTTSICRLLATRTAARTTRFLGNERFRRLVAPGGPALRSGPASAQHHYELLARQTGTRAPAGCTRGTVLVVLMFATHSFLQVGQLWTTSFCLIQPLAEPYGIVHWTVSLHCGQW